MEKTLKSVILADLLQKVLTKNRVYEVHKGETEKLFDMVAREMQKIS